MRLFPTDTQQKLSASSMEEKKNKRKPKGNWRSAGAKTPRSQGPSFPNTCIHRLPKLSRFIHSFPDLKCIEKKIQAGGTGTQTHANRGKSVDSTTQMASSLLPKQREE